MRTVFRLLLVAAFSVGTLAVTAATPAVAQDGPDYVGENPPEGGTTVSGTGSGSGRSSDGGLLPVTGADLAILVALAVAMIGLGWVLMRNARRRHSTPLRT